MCLQTQSHFKIPGTKKTNKQKKDVNKQLCTLRMNQPFSSKEASLVPYK